MALNILVADDSTTVRAVITKTLHLAKVPIGKMYYAADGRKALQILRTEWIDLLLTDINMPVMSGIELVAKMAEDGLLKNIPVVVVSTEGSTDRIEWLKEIGISAYVRKPFTPETIRAVVAETTKATEFEAEKM